MHGPISIQANVGPEGGHGHQTLSRNQNRGRKKRRGELKGHHHPKKAWPQGTRHITHVLVLEEQSCACTEVLQN